MKRFLLSLIVAGGLALMAAPPASATVAVGPPECGNSYAMLLQGAMPSFTTDGVATSAVGVGQVNFGPNLGGYCTATGELIYNAGDVESSPIGDYFGPANCLSDFSAFGGAPCFDGVNHFDGGTLSIGGPAGSMILSFATEYNYFDTLDSHDAYGAFPFGFFLENSKGPVVGISIRTPAANSPSDPGNGAPVLNITLSKQGPGVTAPIPTAWGTAPYVGASALSCSAFGANQTDGTAYVQQAATATSGATITGSLEVTMGSYDIFPDATHAGGELSFNSNNGYVVPSSGPSPDNSFCPFFLEPQNYILGGAVYDNQPSGATAALFADGTSNLFASMEGTFATNPDCENLATAGAGYVDSAVQYGATNANAYVIVTGLFSDSTYVVPSGGMSLCESYQQSPVTVALLTAAKSPSPSKGTPTYGLVTATNKNETMCDTEVSMSGGGTVTTSYALGVKTWNTTCTLSLLPANPALGAAVGPNALAQTVAQTSCLCTCSDTGSYAGVCAANLAATSIGGTLSFASTACPLPATTFPVTCAN
jgi:hypothetical protein